MDNPISYIDTEKAIELFCRMVQIPSPSGMEMGMASWLLTELTAGLDNYGITYQAVKFDEANNAFGGNQGNMFIYVPGTIDSDFILGLQAHLDTVQSPTEVTEQKRFIKPIRQHDRVVSDGTTILSADDKAGIAAILTALQAVKQHKLRIKPLQLIFTVSEETRLRGARYIDKSKIRASEIVSFDGMRPNDVLIGACGSNKLDITLKGLSAHAGMEPEKGASALLAASHAISLIAQGGMWGRSSIMGSDVTVNFVLNGNYTLGANSVQPEVSLIGDLRSFDQEALEKATEWVKDAFVGSCHSTRNIEGKHVELDRFEIDPAYQAWSIPKDSGVAERLARAIQICGMEPNFLTEMGGVDASWFNRHGIPSTVTGMGLYNPHRTDEYILLDEFFQACGVALQLMVAE